MSSLALPDARYALQPDLRSEDRYGWGFLTLMLAVAMLFLRPSDLLSRADAWPLYQGLMIACLVLSARPILSRLSRHELRLQPVTGCLLALVLTVIASHLAQGFVWGARTSAWMAIKVVMLYLAIISLVDTPRRLLAFVHWLVLAITCMAALALLNDYGVISLASLESVRDVEAAAGGEYVPISRIRGTGIFHDPNDLGLVIVPGLVLGLFLFLQPGLGWHRYGWMIPTTILLFALLQTHSRGAFLAMATTVPVFLYNRYGWKAATAGTLAAVPLLAFVFGGRMTEFDAIQEGTGQSRLQIWSDHLYVFRHNPLFGIGEGMLVEEFGVVSHNSFLHCFAELGILGGLAFLAAFLLAAIGLLPTACQPHEPAGAELDRLRRYVLTALLAYAVGLLSLSRQFVAPTYLMLGLAVATQGITATRSPQGRINGFSLLLRGGLASVLFLIAVYAAIQLFVRR